LGRNRESPFSSSSTFAAGWTLNSYTLSQHIPRAQLIIYPDSDHGALFQFPELFVAHGRMFLEGS
jgi:pimeloyl-ACP methyl ester carboxylesterase